MRIIAVDPGVTGAMAFIDAGHIEEVRDMPVFGGEASALQMAGWIKEFNPDTVVVERQQAMPKNGSIAGFKQGLNYGLVLGAAESMRYPVVKMTPQEWKRLNGLIGKDKECSRGLAIQLWPSQEPSLRRKKDHNRAEAMLIGRAFIIKHVMESNNE